MKDINSSQQIPREICKAEMTARMLMNVAYLDTEITREYFQNAQIKNINSFISAINEAVTVVLARIDEKELMEESKLVSSGGNTSFPENNNSVPTVNIEATSNRIKNLTSQIKKLLEDCINSQVAIAKGIYEDSFLRFAYEPKKLFQSCRDTLYSTRSGPVRSKLDELFEDLLTFDKQAETNDLDLNEYRDDIHASLEKFNSMFAHISKIIQTEKSTPESSLENVEIKKEEDAELAFIAEEGLALAN